MEVLHEVRVDAWIVDKQGVVGDGFSLFCIYQILYVPFLV
jgi:hypothetical protein